MRRQGRERKRGVADAAAWIAGVAGGDVRGGPAPTFVPAWRVSVRTGVDARDFDGADFDVLLGWYVAGFTWFAGVVPDEIAASGTTIFVRFAAEAAAAAFAAIARKVPDARDVEIERVFVPDEVTRRREAVRVASRAREDAVPTRPFADAAALRGAIDPKTLRLRVVAPCAASVLLQGLDAVHASVSESVLPPEAGAELADVSYAVVGTDVEWDVDPQSPVGGRLLLLAVDAAVVWGCGEEGIATC